MSTAVRPQRRVEVDAAVGPRAALGDRVLAARPRASLKVLLLNV
jgi:hypothetical protein